jgi:hypothetical protein
MRISLRTTTALAVLTSALAFTPPVPVLRPVPIRKDPVAKVHTCPAWGPSFVRCCGHPFVLLFPGPSQRGPRLVGVSAVEGHGDVDHWSVFWAPWVMSDARVSGLSFLSGGSAAECNGPCRDRVGDRFLSLWLVSWLSLSLACPSSLG